MAATTSTTSTDAFPEDTPIASCRASAKQKQANSWANKRRQSNSEHESATPTKPHQTNNNNDSIPVCQVVCNAWQQLASDIRQKWTLQHNTQKQQQQDEQSLTTRHHQSTRVFPSVLSVLQASAVSHQVVETFQQQQDVTMNVLPSNYNWQQAIQSCTTTRERAFLLLDLSAVTRACISLQAEFGNKVELQYSVQHNRDAKLLELICRLGISLLTNSKMDVEAANKALEEESSQKCTITTTAASRIVDDAGATRKPTGYLRKFLQTRSSSSLSCLAVDGPEEVRRIHGTYQQVQSKRVEHGKKSSLSFILRLPHDYHKWKSLVQTTNQVCSDLQVGLVGVSVELVNDHDEHLDDIREALDSIAPFLDTSPMQVHVTGAGVTRNVAPFLVTLSSSSQYRVSVNASRLLVEHAGALCTRIIGVKTFVDGDETRHVYIDDGCYGSLYRDWANDEQQDVHTPLPLLTTKSTTTQSTTVWGPTCDGLDRVCKNAILPEMQVDEWLVFPDMGLASGMGTAFNGFDAPDVVYCVLGYFREL